MLPPKKVQRNEISLAAPAIAIDVASDRAIVVESSDSDRSSIHSSARSANEATAAGIVVLEAKIGAHRAASNIGSVARLEDAESDGGVSAFRAVTGDNARVGPQPVFIGAESFSSARAEMPL